jgi:hypothetical protein
MVVEETIQDWHTNNLWDQVRYNREAVLESNNVKLIANHASRQIESLVRIPRYDAMRFGQMLWKKADSIMAKEDPTRPYSCVEFNALLELLCNTSFGKKPSDFEKGKTIQNHVHQTPNQQYGRMLRMGVQVSYISNRFSLLDLEREEFLTNFL